MLIGLTGSAGSGKDQSYIYIQEWARDRGRSVRRSAFGDLVKLVGLRALGYQGTDAQCIEMGNSLKQPGWEVIVREPSGRQEHFISGREYVQFTGDEAHRQVFGAEFWIPGVLRDHEVWDYSVITDVRYRNEAEAIRRRAGVIWRVYRPDAGLDTDHASEDGLPPELIDRTIRNDRSLRTLRKRLRSELKSLNPLATSWNPTTLA